MKFRLPDSYTVRPEESSDADVIFEEGENSADLYIRSEKPLEFVIFRWNFTESEKRKERVSVMGDRWERSYGDLSWTGISPEKVMPWYFAVSNGSDSDKDTAGRFTECFGVAVQPDAFCSWQYDDRGVTLMLDMRNGGCPVYPEGRTIHACRVIFEEYRDISAFESLKRFCTVMSPSPLKTDKIIYGSNNWYYAYGKSSYEEIIRDTELVASLCKGNKNRPFMVIDDGWQPILTNPPWKANDRFIDMKKTAEEISKRDVIPGIWVRYLVDEEHVLDFPDEAKRRHDKVCLDPTHPVVKDFISGVTRDIVSWGYKLIKHDYSAYDIACRWGNSMGAKVCEDDEPFYDRTKTTAQIVKDFNKLILENAPDTIILGCNTFSHLSAGSVHIYRTGDDTSGYQWDRTRRMGVNTLAFRACQNQSFYIVDADCVGIAGGIDWELNRRWLDLVSRSGTSLFVSCKPELASTEVRKDLEQAYKTASLQSDEMAPVDWMENSIPAVFRINGKETEYNWYSEDGPELI